MLCSVYGVMLTTTLEGLYEFILQINRSFSIFLIMRKAKDSSKDVERA